MLGARDYLNDLYLFSIFDKFDQLDTLDKESKLIIITPDRIAPRSTRPYGPSGVIFYRMK
ncbi:MAG: hypothetical protein U9Q76_06090 [candidate division WOR-3 bacterium]|nr:hypothetical protein [candidate division WOR-3 bacterium]